MAWTALAWSCVLLAGRSLPGESPPSDVAAGRSTTTDERAELDAALERGIAFLVRDQNRDGSWGSATRTKDLNIYAPVPGSHDAFRTAVTSLCLCALLELESPTPEVNQAIQRGEAWLVQELPTLRRANSIAIYNVWGHAYAISALTRLHALDPENVPRRELIRKLIQQQYEWLDRYESVDGGWGYYDFRAGAKKPATDSTSFLTATVLIAFDEARALGIEPPDGLVQRAIASIHRQRKPDFSYLYGEYLKYSPMAGINRPGGSLGRSQACNVALRRWGDKAVTDEVLVTWLDRLAARNGWLDIGRKRPIPHESHFQVAGYFFYYGHFYAALCIEQLPAELRRPHQRQLAGLILKHQETDGSWWDFPLYNYHQQYGTAYAVMTLLRCRP